MLAGAGKRSMLAQIGTFLREMQLFDFPSVTIRILIELASRSRREASFKGLNDVLHLPFRWIDTFSLPQPRVS